VSGRFVDFFLDFLERATFGGEGCGDVGARYFSRTWAIFAVGRGSVLVATPCLDLPQVPSLSVSGTAPFLIFDVRGGLLRGHIAREWGAVSLAARGVEMFGIARARFFFFLPRSPPPTRTAGYRGAFQAWISAITALRHHLPSSSPCYIFPLAHRQLLRCRGRVRRGCGLLLP
jgi:hypothetical protein